MNFGNDYPLMSSVEAKAEPTFLSGKLDADFGRFLKGVRDNVNVMNLSEADSPGSLAAILEKLGNLRSGEALFVHQEEVPVYLLPHLHARGFDYIITEATSRGICLLIYQS